MRHKLLIILFLAFHLNNLYSQVIDENFWVTNGEVYAFEKKDTTLFIGGNFQYVGPKTGTLVAFAKNSKLAITSFPKFEGTVKTIV